MTEENMLPLLERIDRRLSKIEKHLGKLGPLVEEFEQGLKKLPAGEQLRYAELARSIHNRLTAVRAMLD